MIVVGWLITCLTKCDFLCYNYLIKLVAFFSNRTIVAGAIVTMFNFLTERFSSIFSVMKNSRVLTEKNILEALDKVKAALLEADVPHQVADQFCDDVRVHAVGAKVLSSLKPSEQLIKIVHDRLKLFLGDNDPSRFLFKAPLTVMVMGLQGSGKTTSIAKIAGYLKKKWGSQGKNRKILLASIDFYRPAAVEQLRILAKKADVLFYASSEKNPVEAVQDICNYRKKGCYDILLLDTAGRLHVDDMMMQELRSVQSYLKPDVKIMVLDAMTGQESLQVAKSFDDNVSFDCAMITKMDSNVAGGAALSFCFVIKKPILFIGTGEKIDELEVFYADRMAGRILGMGDIVSLAERAQEKFSKEEQEYSYKSLQQGRLTFQDFMNQMNMVNKLGSISQLVKYIPGIGGQQISQEMLDRGEVEIKKFKAIIDSMTPKERSGAIEITESRTKGWRLAQVLRIQM